MAKEGNKGNGVLDDEMVKRQQAEQAQYIVATQMRTILGLPDEPKPEITQLFGDLQNPTLTAQHIAARCAETQITSRELFAEYLLFSSADIKSTRQDEGSVDLLLQRYKAVPVSEFPWSTVSILEAAFNTARLKETILDPITTTRHAVDHVMNRYCTGIQGIAVNALALRVDNGLADFDERQNIVTYAQLLADHDVRWLVILNRVKDVDLWGIKQIAQAQLLSDEHEDISQGARSVLFEQLQERVDDTSPEGIEWRREVVQEILDLDDPEKRWPVLNRQMIPWVISRFFIEERPDLFVQNLDLVEAWVQKTKEAPNATQGALQIKEQAQAVLLSFSNK